MPLLQELKPACLGVANVYEGQELRSLGWNGKILQLGSFFPEQAALIRTHNITPTITGFGHFTHATRESLPGRQTCLLRQKLTLAWAVLEFCPLRLKLLH